MPTRNTASRASARQMMPSKLPISVELHANETALSLASRIARANGYHDLRAFCTDQGIKLRMLALGAQDAVEHVAAIAGADFTVLGASTASLEKRGWHRIGAEHLKANLVLPQGAQFCPICLAEDAQPYHRAHWHLAHVRTCPRHRVYLQRYASNNSFRDALDFQSFLGDLPAKDELQKAGGKISTLETYILRRIAKGAGDCWLDEFQLHVVVAICEALGALTVRGSDCNVGDLSGPQKTVAGSAGFQLASRGTDAIAVELDRFIQRAGKDRTNYSKILKPFHSCLQANRNDPDFAQMIRFYREFVLDRFYVPFDTSLVGQISAEPRLLTAGVAAKKYDVPLSLLKRQLAQMATAKSEDLRKKGGLPSTLFSLEDMKFAVNEVRKLSSLSACRLAIGAERYLMESLAAEGVIKTHFPRGDGGMPVVHETDLLKFIAKLQSVTTLIDEQAPDNVSFAEAAARCHCTTVWLIDQAIQKNLPLVSAIAEPFRLDDFLVPLAKLRKILGCLPSQTVSVAEAAKLLGYRGTTVQALARAGLLPSQQIDSRLANRARLVFHLADIEQLANQYVRLRGLSGERTETFKRTQKYVRECGVDPIEVGTGIAEFYLRAEIEAIANRPGGERLARLLYVDELRQITQKISRPNRQHQSKFQKNRRET